MHRRLAPSEISGLFPGAREQVGDPQLSCPAFEVTFVELPSRSGEDRDRVMKLTFRHLASTAKPLEFPQDRVLGTFEKNRVLGLFSYRLSDRTPQLLVIKRSRSLDEEVDLERCLFVDGVEGALDRQRLFHR